MLLLITGTAGFIGGRTAQLALDAGHEVLGLDNLNDSYDPRLKRHRFFLDHRLFRTVAQRFHWFRIAPPLAFGP